MRITIRYNGSSGARDYTIYEDFPGQEARIMRTRFHVRFDLEDIYHILTKQQFRQFTDGRGDFNVPRKRFEELY